MDLKRIRWQIGTLALVILAAVTLAGCKASSAAKLPATPEAAIAQVHTACLAGAYQTALPLFQDGNETWKTDPGYAKDLIDRVCMNLPGQRGEHIRIDEHEEKGDGARLVVRTFALADYSDWGRSSEWQLIRTERGWLIVSLRIT